MTRWAVALAGGLLLGIAACGAAAGGTEPDDSTNALATPADTEAQAAGDERSERLEPIMSPADELPSRAEAGRALLTWGGCDVEGCPQPRGETVLTSLRCRPDVIFRGDPIKVICHLGGHYRLEQGGREPLSSDCFYFWRGRTSGGPWAVLAVPDAEFCEE